MKKIVFLLSDISICGGIQRVISQLVNELVKTNKYEITLLSIFHANDVPYFHVDNDIKLSYLFTKKFDLRLNYIKVVKALNNFVKHNDIDVFITAGMGYVPISYWATRKLKSVAWEHSNILTGKKFGLTWLGRQIAAKKFDCIIVITEGDLRNYKKIFSKINRIEQIYNPIEVKVDNQEYNPNIKKIMSCGSLVYKKGYDMLIEVANLVLKKHPDWTWEIYGDGIERKKIEQMIFNYGLEGKVILNGYVKDIEKYYNNHSLFVLTSRSEGFGMVLVEAQRHKLPIVSFKCSGPSEIVSNGKNGYLIDCFDIKQMADSICTLIENNDLRCKFSKQSDADLKRFDSKVISKKWEDLIDSL